MNLSHQPEPFTFSLNSLRFLWFPVWNKNRWAFSRIDRERNLHIRKWLIKQQTYEWNQLYMNQKTKASGMDMWIKQFKRRSWRLPIVLSAQIIILCGILIHFKVWKSTNHIVIVTSIHLLLKEKCNHNVIQIDLANKQGRQHKAGQKRKKKTILHSNL